MKKSINNLLYIIFILISFLEISIFNSGLQYIKKSSNTLELSTKSTINDKYIINDKILSIKKVVNINNPNTKNKKILINYLFINSIINYIPKNVVNNNFYVKKDYFSRKNNKKLFLNKDDL